MLTIPGTISDIQQIIIETIEREYIADDLPVPGDLIFPQPIEHEFLVFRGPVLKLWIVIEKENDPDRKVIVFDPHRQCFGIATRSIGTIPGKGFFIRYCDSFLHALEKSGIILS